MPEIVYPENMVQRRFFSITIRVVLVALGIFLMWRMIAAVTNISGFGENNSFAGDLKNSNVNTVLDSSKPQFANSAGPITITVYYETMCPDSKYFINHQLLPTVEKISGIVNYELIPYGKAKTYENATGIYFNCQHLKLECEGNKIHACAIKHIDNQQSVLKFTSCTFRSMRNPASIAKSCANEVGADWDVIQRCASSHEGSELLKMHGENTRSLVPPVSFIPTILLNRSQGIQKNILKNLKKEVCDLYAGIKPESCL